MSTERNYQIVRKFYKTLKDIECSNFYRIFTHDFTPMTREEAEIVCSKLLRRAYFFDVVQEIPRKA